jgi:Ni/Co efflux regulator RcnB
MKKLLLVLLATLVVSAPMALAAAPAEAATNNRTPRCVTYTEWRHIAEGMNFNEVRRLTGTPGRYERGSYVEDSDGTAEQTVTYHQCVGGGRPSRDKYDTISVYYSNYYYDDDYDVQFTGEWQVSYVGSWYSPN